MSEWPLVLLGEANVVLIDCVHKTPAEQTEGLPYVAIPQMKDGRIDVGDARRISPRDFAEWTQKANPQAYDVVLSRRCNPGVTAPVPPGLSFALGQNLVLLRADGSRVHPPFLRWLVRGPTWWEQIGKFINVGAVFDSLKCADVPKFELPLPPLDEQRRIAAVLGALDDKIELNRKMNRTLEAMAQAIFQAFLPSEDVLNVAAPRTWERTTLGAWCDQLGGEVQTGPFGSQLHAAEYVNDGVPSVMPSNIKDDRISEVDIARVAESTARRLSKHMLQLGDIIYSRRGDVERCALVTGRESGWLCGTGCLRVRLGGSPDDSHFLYRYFGHPDVRAWIVRHAQGATMPNLNTQILRAVPLLLPPQVDREKLGITIKPLFARREANHLQSATLAALRDTLLPKLISGELRIPEAEAAVEAAT